MSTRSYKKEGMLKCTYKDLLLTKSELSLGDKKVVCEVEYFYTFFPMGFVKSKSVGFEYSIIETFRF